MSGVEEFNSDRDSSGQAINSSKKPEGAEQSSGAAVLSFSLGACRRQPPWGCEHDECREPSPSDSLVDYYLHRTPRIRPILSTVI